MREKHSKFHMFTAIANQFYAIFWGLILTKLILLNNSAKAYRTSTSHWNRASWLVVFLRERGWKCKALQSQLERLCILYTSIDLCGEKLMLELRWKGVCPHSETPRTEQFIATFILCIIRRADIISAVQSIPLQPRYARYIEWLGFLACATCYQVRFRSEDRAWKKLLAQKRRGKYRRVLTVE